MSSSLMATSSSSIVGLRSHKVDFDDVDKAGQTITARGFMAVSDGDRPPRDEAWSQDLIKVALTGWWAGDRTGNQISRVGYFPNRHPSR